MARFEDLDAATLYALVRLRVDVFVVEQECAYPELDGRDLDADTQHVWIEGPDGVPSAYLRVLEDGEALRIGRVATAQGARGRGLAGDLMRRALELADGLGGRAVVLDAQAHLAGWYERFGFVRSGEDFVEDGIPHTPMRREPRTGRTTS